MQVLEKNKSLIETVRANETRIIFSEQFKLRGNKIKIGIVGPSEEKWPKEQIPKRNCAIHQILDFAKNRNGLAGHYGEMKWMENSAPPYYGFYSWNNCRPLPVRGAEIIMVSGHCSVGEELPFCITCNKWLQNGKGMFTSEETHRLMKHQVLKVFKKGGVDTWAEIIATRLGIQKEIYPVEVRQWADKVVESPEKVVQGVFIPKGSCKTTFKGYRSRNIQIAKALDFGYCIVPHVSLPQGFDITIPETLSKKFACFHCHEVGHPTNGGCWTMQHANKLGKETHLVVIR